MNLSYSGRTRASFELNEKKTIAASDDRAGSNDRLAGEN